LDPHVFHAALLADFLVSAAAISRRRGIIFSIVAVAVLAEVLLMIFITILMGKILAAQINRAGGVVLLV